MSRRSPSGQAFVNWRGCGGAMAEAAGANRREQRRWSWLAARYGLPSCTGMRQRAWVNANSKSSVILIDMATRARQLVLCLRNRGYEASLERRKLFQVIPDRNAEKLGQFRVIDESGEDYLYPATFFAVVKLPPRIRRRVLA